MKINRKQVKKEKELTLGNLKPGDCFTMYNIKEAGVYIVLNSSTDGLTRGIASLATGQAWSSYKKFTPVYNVNKFVVTEV